MFPRAIAVALLLPVAGVAEAATFTADDLLRQYNIIAFDDLTLNEEVEWRACVGGSLRMGQAAQPMFDRTANQPGFNDEGVIVGNVTGSTLNVQNGSSITAGGDVTSQTLELNGHGTAQIGGKLTANANQGGKLTRQATSGPDLAGRLPAGVEGAFTIASTDLSAPSGVAAEIVGSQLRFGARPGEGLTVHEIDFATLANASELRFDLNGARTVVINMTGTSGTIAANIVTGGTAFEDLADQAVWNFAAASKVTLDRQMWGFMLAPLAHLEGSGTNHEGTIVARSIVTHGEMHGQDWRGALPQADAPPAAVPVPAALPLMLAAMGGLGLLRRARRA